MLEIDHSNIVQNLSSLQNYKKFIGDAEENFSKDSISISQKKK